MRPLYAMSRVLPCCDEHPGRYEVGLVDEGRPDDVIHLIEDAIVSGVEPPWLMETDLHIPLPLVPGPARPVWSDQGATGVLSQRRRFNRLNWFIERERPTFIHLNGRFDEYMINEIQYSRCMCAIW